MCALAQPRARAAAQPRPRQPPERSPSPRAPPGSTPSMCWPRRARWARFGSQHTWERRRCPRCRSSPPTSPSRSSTSRTPRHARARPSASPAPRRAPAPPLHAYSAASGKSSLASLRVLVGALTCAHPSVRTHPPSHPGADGAAHVRPPDAGRGAHLLTQGHLPALRLLGGDGQDQGRLPRAGRR